MCFRFCTRVTDSPTLLPLVSQIPRLVSSQWYMTLGEKVYLPWVGGHPGPRLRATLGPQGDAQWTSVDCVVR